MAIGIRWIWCRIKGHRWSRKKGAAVKTCVRCPATLPVKTRKHKLTEPDPTAMHTYHDERAEAEAREGLTEREVRG